MKPENQPGLTARAIERNLDRRIRVGPVDLDLKPGTVGSLVGESGSGKTTIARMFAGLDRPDRGVVSLSGRPVWTPRPGPEFRRTVQYLPQAAGATLDPAMSARRIVEEVLRLRGRPTSDWAESFATVQLDPSLGLRRPGQLSGGQRRRLGWARILALEPEYLILDEPLTGLDPDLRTFFGDRIIDLAASGTAVLVISHDLHAVFRLASTVSVVWRGRIIESGPTQSVLRSPAHPYTRRLLRAVPVLATRI